MIKIEANRFYVCVWHFELPKELTVFGKGGNVFAVLSAGHQDDDHWLFEWRFRHYKDTRIHDHEDQMSFFSVRSKGTLEEARGRAQAGLALMSAAAGAKLDEVEVMGSGERAADLMHTLPFMHIQKLETEEARSE